jgi:hypothetical protein
LERLVAVVFSQFTTGDAFEEIAFDSLNTVRERLAVHVAQDDRIACEGCDLRDAVSHRARAEHGD